MFFAQATSTVTHQYLMPVFRCLRTLHLDISFDWSVKESAAIRRSGKTKYSMIVDLIAMLGAAQHLEDLKIAGPSPDGVLLLARIVSNYTWSRLRVVKFQYHAGTLQDLRDFISRHTMSLWHMTIDHFSFIPGGDEKELRAVYPTLSPDLELICGLLFKGKRCCAVETIFPLDSDGFDESGLRINKERKIEQDTDDDDEEDDGRDEDEDENGNENDTEDGT